VGSIEDKAKIQDAFKNCAFIIGSGIHAAGIWREGCGTKGRLIVVWGCLERQAVLIRNWPEALRQSSGESPTNVCDES
jgi:hypothetical protein